MHIWVCVLLIACFSLRVLLLLLYCIKFRKYGVNVSQIFSQRNKKIPKNGRVGGGLRFR